MVQKDLEATKTRSRPRPDTGYRPHIPIPTPSQYVAKISKLLLVPGVLLESIYVQKKCINFSDPVQILVSIKSRQDASGYRLGGLLP